jgi:hypothetical protein
MRTILPGEPQSNVDPDYRAGSQHWNGSHIQNSSPAIVVKYHGPTDTRGSLWRATLKRDSNTRWVGTASFNEGPIAAARNLLSKRVELADWPVSGCYTIDPDTYAVTIG